MPMRRGLILLALLATGLPAQERPRLRDLGVKIGIFPPGPLNAITDVAGVAVGQTTIREGSEIRTGVTAILPHAGNLFREKVPAAIVVGNGFGKLIGVTQVQELGQIESPIALTNTLSVWDVARATARWMLQLPGNEDVRSINVVVGETNDGALNDIRAMAVREEHVWSALRTASSGPVEEGSVGAGTGTVCFGWKGGIGTSSRMLPRALGDYTVGVLVQTNYGGVLDIAGVPIGRELGRYAFRDQVESGDGSCMIVLATDAPLDARQLERLARRAPLALGRSGSAMSHGSGDYVVAFSTARSVRMTGVPVDTIPRLHDEALSALFQAAVEAVEESIANSLLKAESVTGVRGRTVEALPVDRVKELFRKYGRTERPAE